jgi:uncharacterized small protein (DUF1192 family)
MSGMGRTIAVFTRNARNFLSIACKGAFLLSFCMFDDDLDPKKKPSKLKNLEPMSIDELASYIEDLKAEIIRTEAEIAKKKAYANAASSFFKS